MKNTERSPVCFGAPAYGGRHLALQCERVVLALSAGFLFFLLEVALLLLFAVIGMQILDIEWQLHAVRLNRALYTFKRCDDELANAFIPESISHASVRKKCLEASIGCVQVRGQPRACRIQVHQKQSVLTSLFGIHANTLVISGKTTSVVQGPEYRFAPYCKREVALCFGRPCNSFHQHTSFRSVNGLADHLPVGLVENLECDRHLKFETCQLGFDFVHLAIHDFENGSEALSFDELSELRQLLANSRKQYPRRGLLLPIYPSCCVGQLQPPQAKRDLMPGQRHFLKRFARPFQGLANQIIFCRRNIQLTTPQC